MFNKILIVWACLFTISLAASTFNYRNHYTSKERSRIISLHKNGQHIGFLYGTFHYGATEQELKPTIDHLDQNIRSINEAFFEAATGHWSNMADGMEKYVHKKIEQHNQKENNQPIATKTLETLDQQMAMLSSLYYRFNKVHYIPYGSLYANSPGLAQVINFTHRLLWLVPNSIYGLFDGSAAQNQQLINQKITKTFRTAFFAGKAAALDSRSIEQFRIIDRDKRMFDKLKPSLEMATPTKQIAIFIGMGHLSTEKGIVSHLEQFGIQCEDITLTN